MELRIRDPPYWTGSYREILSDDAVLVLSAYEHLRGLQYVDRTVIDDAAKTLVDSLDKSESYTALLKLSLMTWRFNASSVPSEELTRFLRQPNNQYDWEWIHAEFKRHTGNELSLSDFKASCDLLLWPSLGSVFNVHEL